jgi:hypothetical protein
MLVPSPLLAVHVDLPAGLLDEPVDHAQPEAGALAHALGREEWIEDLVADGRRNAAAGIAHCDHDIVAGRSLGMRVSVRFIERDVAGLERELSALGHGIARVDREVEQRRGELGGIDKRGPGMFVERHLDLDLFAERGSEQLLSIDDQRVDIGFARLQRLLACESEKTSGQLRPAPRSGRDQLGRFHELWLVGNAVRQNADDRGDGGEHVVEIVRNAAGQLSDGLHLLRLPHLLLGGDLAGDVAHQQVVDVAVTPAHAAHRYFDLDLVPVLAQRIDFEALAFDASHLPQQLVHREIAGPIALGQIVG